MLSYMRHSAHIVLVWATLCIVLLASGGCGFRTPSTISQGSGLPDVRRLNWGFAWNSMAHWSPDGRWIALLAGNSLGDAHLEVVRSDGAARYDLSRWGCGGFQEFDIAWSPDNHLTCARTHLGTFRLCTGTPPSNSCQSAPLPHELRIQGLGAVWSPDGEHLLIAASPGDPATTANPSAALNVITPQGDVSQVLIASHGDGYAFPQWRPHTSELSYILDPNLMISTVTEGTEGFLLGPPRVVATGQVGGFDGYAWAPSGHWMAIRHADYQQGDKISLVNPDQPAQTVDVALAEKVGQQLTDPIWSPDGLTLIVFGVNDNQPYAINIADYLRSKGLQP